MQRSTLGSRRQGRHSSGKTNGLLDDDMVVDQDHISDYEENGAQDDGDQDMSDDDDDEDPFAQQRMPEQHPAIRTTVQLMELMDGDRPYLDLNPHYQRNVVWTRKAKQMLIDSMFGGFFVPPVIFNVTQVVDENGSARYKRTCVDGKQRLTSIRDFMRGKFPWTAKGKSWYYTTPSNDDGSRKANVSLNRVLPDDKKQFFGRKALVCVEYKDLSQQQEIELFQRVQLGKPLTKAETFRASQGVWQDLAKTFETDYAEVIGLCKHNNRASGFWLILQCFSQIYECMDPSTPDGIPRIRTRARDTERLCSNGSSLDRATKTQLRQIFDRFLGLVREDPSVFKSEDYKKAKVFAPIELVAVCCMISQWGDSRPNGLYRGDIRGLRERLRGVTNLQVRASDDCWTICWNYIDDLDGIRGTIDGSTAAKGPHASDYTEDPTVAVRPEPPSQRASAPTVPSMLRRRGTPGEDDGDYRPTASAKKPGPSQRKKPGRVPKPKDGPPRVPRQRASPKPFAGHYPVWKPGDNDPSSSSSSDDDDVNTPGMGPPVEDPTQNVPTTSARKRALMELGSGNNASLDLEAKKAKLMAVRVKQEPGT